MPLACPRYRVSVYSTNYEQGFTILCTSWEASCPTSLKCLRQPGDRVLVHLCGGRRAGQGRTVHGFLWWLNLCIYDFFRKHLHRMSHSVINEVG